MRLSHIRWGRWDYGQLSWGGMSPLRGERRGDPRGRRHFAKQGRRGCPVGKALCICTPKFEVLKESVPAGAWGQGTGQVSCHRFSESISELTQLSGGFLEDNYLDEVTHPSLLQVYTSLCSFVKGPEGRQRGRTNRWTEYKAQLGHTLPTRAMEWPKRAGLEALQ